MIRLYVTDNLKSGRTVSADEKQHHYLAHVMRVKAGEMVLLFNGRDGEWRASVSDITKKGTLFTIQTQTRSQQATSGAVLAVSLIKKEALDWVLQKATELGVQKIIPIIAARSVVSQLNMERARHILIEAAEQCERLDVPMLAEPVRLKAFLENLPDTQTPVFLNERGTSAGTLRRGTTPCFIIGPEGGWTAEELALFTAHPAAVGINLGRLILRAETAAISVLAAHRFDLFASAEQ
ncbi:MAG: 16S rRNA (uracil(1498)-N(3))-methyltransferase [Alphaproteobacteria bacterium]